MRKITFFILLCISIAWVNAQYPQALPITHSSFFATGAMGANPVLEKGEYPSGNTTATIMADQWNLSNNSAARAGSSPNVENSNLSYSNYIDNNTGKAINLLASNATRRSIYSLTSGSIYANTDFYLGALINVSAITATGYILSLDGAHTNNVVRAAVFVRVDDDGYNIGLSTVNNTTNVFNWSAKLNLNETYFIVIKVNPKTTANYTFYVNPTIGNTEAQSTPLSNDAVASGGITQIRGINVQQATGINAKIAGLRFSDNWADVVKAQASTAPKLNAPVVGTASSVTASGFTANWTATANANGYDVQVFQGVSLVKTVNFSGQATNSGAITSLNAVTPYTYKVVAKGDGVSYSDSDPSAASAEITTAVYTENFTSATVGSDLEGYDTWAMSTNTGWQSGTSPVIGATPLVYPGYLGSNIGKVALISKNNTTRASVKPTSLAPLADGSAVYASLLVKIDGASASGLREFFALNQTMAEFTRARVSAEHFPDDNTVQFAVGKASAKSSPSKSFSAADTHLLVFKYDKIVGSNNDKISLYINPDLSLSESEQANAIIDYEDASQTDWGNNIAHLLIRQTGLDAKIGGIRVANTWGQVIPASALPALSTPIVGAASAVGATTFTANWTAVANASGYKVFVYQGTSVISVTTVAGQATESLAVANLVPNTEYTYKVLALGDAYVTYSDSQLSAASSQVATSVTTSFVAPKATNLYVVGKSISASEAGTFEVYNLQGASVYRTMNVSVAHTALPTGLYLLQFTNNSGQRTSQKIRID